MSNKGHQHMAVPYYIGKFEAMLSVDHENKRITISETRYHDSWADAMEKIQSHEKKIIETENELIKAGLIALGWTPPKGKA